MRWRYTFTGPRVARVATAGSLPLQTAPRPNYDRSAVMSTDEKECGCEGGASKVLSAQCTRTPTRTCTSTRTRTRTRTHTDAHTLSLFHSLSLSLTRRERERETRLILPSRVHHSSSPFTTSASSFYVIRLRPRFVLNRGQQPPPVKEKEAHCDCRQRSLGLQPPPCLWPLLPRR
jgi:hypothetical protein